MELITGVEPKCFVLAHLANEIAPCKLIQASLGLLILRCGFKIPIIGFRNLDSRFRSFTGFRIPWAGFRILQAKNSRIRESRLLGWNKEFDFSPRPSYVPLQRVGFLRRFWSENGYKVTHFGLESGMVFKGTTGVYERIYCFISKWIRKKEKYANSKWILRNLFCCWSNLSNHDIISKRPGLRVGMNFRGQVWKLVWKLHFLVSNMVSIWRTGWHTPTKNSQVYPPPGIIALTIFKLKVAGARWPVYSIKWLLRTTFKIGGMSMVLLF